MCSPITGSIDIRGFGSSHIDGGGVFAGLGDAKPFPRLHFREKDLLLLLVASKVPEGSPPEEGPCCRKNGTKLKVAHKPVKAGLYPTIGLHRCEGLHRSAQHSTGRVLRSSTDDAVCVRPFFRACSKGEIIRLNFCQTPFVFDLEVGRGAQGMALCKPTGYLYI